MAHHSRWRSESTTVAFTLLVLTVGLTGCYAPLHSPGIPASSLPESFRMPVRSLAAPLNYANLTVSPPEDYILGPGDLLEVTVPDLYQGAEFRPMLVRIMADGRIHLPLLDAIELAGLNLLEAQQAVEAAYANGFFDNPRVNIALAEKATVDVVVLGEVTNPGVYPLPKYQNDVGHALAAAGGLTELADSIIEVHRRLPSSVPLDDYRPAVGEEIDGDLDDPKTMLRIPLRGLPPGALRPQNVILHPGDVVVVPSRSHEVFWVVGELDQTNLVRFTLGNRERELGAGLVLPRDRDIDVVTAVAMAGYIDPINSPTTVTVHRTLPNGDPMLIRVDLIAARYDRRQTVMVQAGDIIYLNPDAAWYSRRLFDRVVDDLILLPYRRIFFRRNN